MKMARALVLVGSLVLLSVAAPLALAQDAAQSTPDMPPVEWPETLTLEAPGLMPEGIAYDSERGVFLVGSLSTGAIHRVLPEGSLELLATSDNVTTSVGLEVDASGGRVLAAVSNNPDRTLAALGAFDLATGEELAYVDLSALTPETEGHFANDVAVDAEGNAYVTDSLAGAIYRVTPDYEPSVFLRDETFAQPFALNGIAYHEDGYLLAMRAGDLIRIPLDDPESFTVVEADPAVSFAGGDGIIFLDASTLILVSGQQQRVMRIESDDDWASASVTGQYETQPISSTTAAITDEGEVYVVYARFQQPDAETYPIERVDFAEPEM